MLYPIHYFTKLGIEFHAYTNSNVYSLDQWFSCDPYHHHNQTITVWHNKLHCNHAIYFFINKIKQINMDMLFVLFYWTNYQCRFLVVLPYRFFLFFLYRRWHFMRLSLVYFYLFIQNMLLHEWWLCKYAINTWNWAFFNL